MGVCVDSEGYLYPCHQGKSLAVVANGAASLCYVGVAMYVSVLTVRIICIHATRSGGNGAASVCYAVCACGSTVRGTCIHATRGGKSVLCCMCIL